MEKSAPPNRGFLEDYDKAYAAAGPTPDDSGGQGNDSSSDDAIEDSGGSNAAELWTPPDEGLFASSMTVRMMPQDPKMIDLARSRAMDPTVFDEAGPPYIWGVEASNQRLDSYGTKMHDSSLKNYAADAQDGVSFQNSHNTRELGFGRSIDGHYYDGRSQGGKRMEGTFFTLPDLNLNGVNTDQLIRGMRAGIVKDVSIGFYGGTMECSVCGRSIWDWDCEHISFLFGGNSIDESTGEPAFVWVKDAHLAEVSAVYDGATPGAGILKAQREAELGRIRPEAARFLEARFRMRLPAGPSPRFAGVEIPQRGGNEMGAGSPAETAEKTASAQAEKPQIEGIAVESIRSVVQEAGGDVTLDPMVAIRELGNELKRLRPLADDGRAYRSDLIDEALAQGVRAHGNDFKQEVYRAVMEASTIDVIKQMRDDWREAGDGFFAANGTKAGGRQTDLRQDEAPKPKRGARVPESAFRV